MNAGGVQWRESPSSDRWSNLDFLGKGKARSAWADSWPEDGYDFSWDAVGRVQIGKVGWEWLLVTAFAAPGELELNLESPIERLDGRVTSVIEAAQRGFKIEPYIEWRHGNMFLGTRLSALSFLRQHGVCVRMLSVYFHDEHPGQHSPFPRLAAWDPAIVASRQRLGLTGDSALERRTYRLFLPAI